MPGSLEPLDLGIQIPYHFRCPISLELMQDPVTVSTGQTYDRTSIESWVATGNDTCPVTRAPLTDFTLIPNHTLRRLIQDWCVSNRSFGVERIPTPKQPAEAPAVRALLHQIASDATPRATRLHALRRVRGLARDSEKNRIVIASLNARRILTEVVFRVGIGEDLSLEALSAVVMFPFTETECAAVVSEPDRVARLEQWLFHRAFDVRVNAAALVEILAAGSRSVELRSGAMFEGVVGVVREWGRAGVKALFAMCLVRQTRGAAVAAGAAEALVDRLAGAERGDAERALATVELLCRVPAGVAALMGHALTVPTLVKLILRVSERATEYAAGALLALCTAGEECQVAAVAAGVVTQLLLLVQSDCTDRAKRKAQMLLKLLRDSWPHESFVRNSDDYACSELMVPFS